MISWHTWEASDGGNARIVLSREAGGSQLMGNIKRYMDVYLCVHPDLRDEIQVMNE